MAAAGASAALSACSSPETFAPLPAADGPFKHGVASGDPDQTSLVLWTAVTSANDLPVLIEVSSTPDFADIIFEDEITPTGPETAGATPYKVLVEQLQPGAQIWYRFTFREQISPTGTAKTLPEGSVEQFKIAAFSCSNYPAGFFNVYRHAAENAQMDLIVHLGDYLYEYAVDGYASADAERLSRQVDPAHEILSYEDYARRHAQYSADPDLRALKAAAPLVMIWDDHETANNSWRDGAQNHNEGEGSWTERRDNALLAWQHWTPSRDAETLHERWGTLQIGDLASLIFLETRLTARSPEVTLDQFPLDVDDPANDPEDPEIRAIVSQWLDDAAGDESRTLLGERQLGDVSSTLEASVQAGQPWRIFANQVIMGRVPAPNYAKEMPFWLRWAIQMNDPLAWAYIKVFGYGTPFNLDAWDGYPAERERLYAAARRAGADFITLTGDTHNHWVLDLKDEGGTRVGTEFGVTSVSSPSRFERLDLPGVDFGIYTEDGAPEVLRHNAYDRGYLVLTLTPDDATAELMTISTVKSRDFTSGIDSRWRIQPASDGQAQQVERIS
jgi:phosphodiesterase/alkaline phosphatase D-like protein